MVTESKRQSVFYPHGCNFKNLCSMGLPAVILGVSDFQSHPESGLGTVTELSCLRAGKDSGLV